MTFRDIGKRLSRNAPIAENWLRSLYNSLPEYFHDTPAARAQSYFRNEDNVQFIQIGAYDGVAGDPIRPLVISNSSWSGVLVEPQRTAFSLLEKNYSEQRSRLTFINGLMTAHQNGSEELFYIHEDEIRKRALPEWARELASFDPSQIHKTFPNVSVASEDFPAYTFEQLASFLPSSRVDLIVMDVEGAEGRLIPSIDFEKHRVKFLIFEHKHLNNDDLGAVFEHLRTQSMSLKQFGRDTIAWRA